VQRRDADNQQLLAQLEAAEAAVQEAAQKPAKVSKSVSFAGHPIYLRVFDQIVSKWKPSIFDCELRLPPLQDYNTSKADGIEGGFDRY